VLSIQIDDAPAAIALLHVTHRERCYFGPAGTILWRMGPPDNLTPGDFIFNNTWNDPWEWFSHQHDVGIENGGAGPMTIMDNGNTRVSLPPLGLGTGCSPYDCDSRGMALTVDESSMTVTPVVSYDLGSYSPAMGSAQLLGDGNYFFENAIVFVQAQGSTFGYSIEISGIRSSRSSSRACRFPHESFRSATVPRLADGEPLQSLHDIVADPFDRVRPSSRRSARRIRRECNQD
jgi:hypothetical protein